jgi:hypothetical protein
MPRNTKVSAVNASESGPPSDVWGRLEPILERFEEAWQRGERPVLDEYLAAAVPAERRALLVELVHEDLHYRLTAGEAVRVENYLERYPELGSDPAVALDLIAAEYAVRRQREPGCIPAEYLQRFPRYREALRARLHMPASSGGQAGLATAGGGQGGALQPISEPKLISEDDPVTGPPVSAGPMGRVDASERREPRVLEARSVSPQEGEPISLSPAAESSQPSGIEPQTVPPREGGPTEPVPGPTRSLGDYELLAELGRGGMGVVYKARQISLNRLVAVKMILGAEHASPDMLARFRVEAEAIARLQHPNIIQIHEVGEVEGKPFFSLEYCAGAAWRTNSMALRCRSRTRPAWWRRWPAPWTPRTGPASSTAT